MPNFCLMPDAAKRFKQGLVDGTLNPERLADMSSEARNELFGQFVGPNNAKAVNSAFESKLLLKNQKQGFLTWAKQVSGVKPNVRRDLVAKIERMQNVLDPAEHEQFMKDLTATRLGVDVTQGEAKKIADLSKKVTDFEALRRPDNTFANKEQRMNYGRSVEDLTDYVAGLKTDAEKIRPSELIHNKGLLGMFTSKAAGNLKSLQASLDNSAVFRQGWKLLFTDPNIWRKNAAQTFITGAKTLGGKNVLREVNADIISRPNYDKYVRAGLAIKSAEEAFPESLAEKVPALGRLYKASEAAFTGFQYKNRADVFDKYLQIAEKRGVDIGDTEQLKSIGKLVNALTGRGHLGKAEPVANVVNNVFFSPRFLKSNLDTLTAHKFQKGATTFVKRKAAVNLLKIVGGTATILATADVLLPGSVELDPRSSDFGKIRAGDTRFDVSGGMGSVLTLAARIVSRSSKSSTTKRVTKLNSGGFGSQTTLDVLENFTMNKLSPALQIVKDLMTGQDFNGNPVTAGGESKKAITPIAIQNFQELKDNPKAANLLLGVIADGLGIGANTYSPAGGGGVATWTKSKSKELTEFKKKVGNSKFNSAAKEYDSEFNDWTSRVQGDERYKRLSDDDKAALISKKKATLQKDILKKNGFKYKAQKSKKIDKSLL